MKEQWADNDIYMFIFMQLTVLTDLWHSQLLIQTHLHMKHEE